MEIIIGGEDGNIHIFNGDGMEFDGDFDGQPDWPQTTGGSIFFSTPAVGDLDDDYDHPGLEIVVGSMDGKVYAYHMDGTPVSGWPIQLTTALDDKWFTGGIWAPPSIGDINGDGLLEVIVATGDWTGDGYAYLLNYQGGIIWNKTLTNGRRITTSPAIGNLNDDKHPEIVIGGGIGAASGGSIYILDYNGNFVNTLQPRTKGSDSSPVIGDINNDGIMEIIIGSTDNKVYVYSANGGPAISTFLTEGKIHSTPTICDIDKNGKVDIMCASNDSKVYIWDSDAVYSPESIKWGMYCHDERHTGLYYNPAPAPPKNLIANVYSLGGMMAKVCLFWNSSMESDFKEYHIYRKGGYPFEPKMIGITSIPSFCNVIYSGIYYYWVTAVDDEGNESFSSNVVEVYNPIGGGIIYSAGVQDTVSIPQSLEDTVVVFLLKWPGSDLDLVLYSPSGELITPQSPSVLRFVETDTSEWYIIRNPLAGDWTVNIVAVSVPPEGTEYTLQAVPIEIEDISFNVPQNYPTIQSAIDSAYFYGGGIVNISTGVYYEHNIVLRDKVDVWGSSGDNTIVDGCEIKNVFVADNITSSSIRNLTIKGSSPNGQGDCALLVTGNSVIKVSDCIFTENKNCLSARGSAIVFSIDNTVSNNTGRAFDVRGNALIQITNNIIANNGEDFHKVGQGRIVLWSDSLVGADLKSAQWVGEVKGEEKLLGNLGIKGKADNGSVVLTAIEVNSKPFNTPAEKTAIDKYCIFAGLVNSTLILKFPIPTSSNKGQNIQSQSSFDVLSFNEQNQQWEVLPSTIDGQNLSISFNNLPVVLTLAEGQGTTSVLERPKPDNLLPNTYRLSQNYPNPFNPTTTINYWLPKDSFVMLKIYNFVGQLVETLVDENQQAGYYNVRWDGRSVASGLYYYRIVAGEFAQSRKMILLK